jgi:hypothetical protein
MCSRRRGWLKPKGLNNGNKKSAYKIFSLKLLIKELQHSGAKKKKLVTINEGSLQSNWARLLNNPTTTQLVVSNQTNEMNQQLVISKHVTIEKP